jgi:hypothetical protein
MYPAIRSLPFYSAPTAQEAEKTTINDGRNGRTELLDIVLPNRFSTNSSSASMTMQELFSAAMD